MNTIFVLALTIGVIYLQIILSKKKNRGLGLILPGIMLFFSLISVLGYIGIFGMSNVLQLLYILLVSNIPTIVLLVIYFNCREKMNTRNQLDKMSIQDLD